jgi:hypothetical protein
MKNTMLYTVLCGACFALLGCAGEQRRFTGFLSDYSILEPDTTIQGALVYWNPEIDPTDYKAVLVEPVEIHFRNRNEENRTKPEELAAFRRFVNDELTAAIGKHAAIVTKPAPNVLRCRLQVANLRLTQPIGEPVYPWPPDYALGSANVETDARDSISGELVAAYVSPKCSGPICSPSPLASPPDRWEAAKTAIRNRIVTWTDHGARHFASSKNATAVVSSPNADRLDLRVPFRDNTLRSLNRYINDCD